jgi:hypothetical protein
MVKARTWTTNSSSLNSPSSAVISTSPGVVALQIAAGRDDRLDVAHAVIVIAHAVIVNTAVSTFAFQPQMPARPPLRFSQPGPPQSTPVSAPSWSSLWQETQIDATGARSVA